MESSIEFASRILQIDTEGIEPMYTVLENEKLHLREDIPFTHNTQERILSNAAITEEYYFVAPPGNIPLEQSDSPFNSSKKSNNDDTTENPKGTPESKLLKHHS